MMPPPPTVPQLRRPIRPEDVASVASDSSVYAGIGDAVTVALRGLRKTMKAKRDEYVAVLKEADKMDDDEFDDSKPDIDATRQRLWSATWRYVNQSRTYADAEKSRDVDKATSMLTAAQSSLVEIRALWEKTSFFDKNTFAANQFLPTHEEIFNEPPGSGAKRAFEVSGGSSLHYGQPLARRRTSTPNETAADDELPMGAEASNQDAANDQRNAPHHVPEALQNPEEIRINFEPPTPGRRRPLRRIPLGRGL